MSAGGSRPRKARAAASPPARALAAAATILIVLVAGTAVGGLALAARLDEPTGHIPPEGLSFTVSPGEGGASVARRLRDAGAIRSDVLFRLLMKAKRQEASLKAGEYLLEPSMRSSDVLAVMVEGRQLLIRLVVPEGATLRAIASAAEAAGVATAADVVAAASDPKLLSRLGLAAASADGYLFPDTYLLPRDSGGERLVELMVSTFKGRLAAAVPESASLSASELHERVVLASIVEREYRLPEEAPLMAGVFLNRLRIGMALQSCATVVYVITERQGKPHPSRLFDRDIKIQDPFNTYVRPGLPPAPIANPGLTALTASLRPASTRYLYFRLVDEERGAHHFSETLDEHVGAATLRPKAR